MGGLWELPKGACARGVCLLAVVAAVLAVFAVPDLRQPVALASSAQALNWAQQHPATSPTARAEGSMAYDAATGSVVLFGGGGRYPLAGTWTWDGSTWTRQHPATSPPTRWHASMAYDAATRTVVLFGGSGRYGQRFGGTWTWDGSTWAKQHPATSPPARAGASMAYDKATGTVVLFGGANSDATGVTGDTWTWDGSTWAKQHPATSPPARKQASMAYDQATGTVVLFGGINSDGLKEYGDTWTWDGSTWAKQHPATSPPTRYSASMAYHAATGTVVLFGGVDSDATGVTEDTWTWGH